MGTLTILDDVIFPKSKALASGLRGKSTRANLRTRSPNGQIGVNIVQARSYREYEFGSVPMAPAVWNALEALFEVTDAGASGFLLEDPKDSITGPGAGFLVAYGTAELGTVGLGYGMPVHRMKKRYAALNAPAYNHDRRISRPKAPVTGYRNGTPLVVGAGAGEIAIDYVNGGTITFGADVAQALVSITVGATTTLTFANGTGMVAAVAIGQRVYLSGISGTAAASLNSLSHVVDSIGATTIVLSTVTTGLVGTGGTASKFPQTSDALTWTGGFYVPVHFANDAIDWTLRRPAGEESGRLLTGPSIVLEEVPE